MDRHGLDLWLTGKNVAFLESEGFLKADAELLVRRLHPRDYSSGPEPDDDARRPAGEVWKFYTEFEGYDLYVKLKLELPECNSVPSICMSFHPAEAAMRRPLGETQEQVLHLSRSPDTAMRA